MNGHVGMVLTVLPMSRTILTELPRFHMADGPHIRRRKTAPRERLVPDSKARLQDQIHEVCRFRHLSPRTEEAYWGWMRRFLVHHKRGGQWRHPAELGAAEVQGFLTHLAVDRKVAVATQNQALNALVFCFEEVLGHSSVQTTQIYLHVMQKPGLGVRSPLDAGPA